MADLHRAGRYDRMSDDVRTLTRQRPLSVHDFVRKNAAKFTASAKAAWCLPMLAEFVKGIAEPVVTYAVREGPSAAAPSTEAVDR